MTRIYEIDRCNPDCRFHSMKTLVKRYCFHYEVMNGAMPRKIPFITMTNRNKPFPDWCPLPEKEEEPEEFLPDLKY